jgi:hypothetical protein
MKRQVVLLSLVTIIMIIITITASAIHLMASSISIYNNNTSGQLLGLQNKQQQQLPLQSPLSLVESMREEEHTNLTKPITASPMSPH